MTKSTNSVKASITDNKASNVDFNFGFTNDELHLMYSHFNGLTYPVRRERQEDGSWERVFFSIPSVFNMDMQISKFNELYELGGYQFDWGAFERKLRSLDHWDFIKLMKMIMVEWVDIRDLIEKFYTIGGCE